MCFACRFPFNETIKQSKLIWKHISLINLREELKSKCKITFASKFHLSEWALKLFYVHFHECKSIVY